MSTHTNCIFCKIIAQEIPATVIAQNDSVLVIKDLYPQAPLHYLIIPKKHIVDLGDLTADDAALASSLLLMAQQLSEIDSKHRQFKLVCNNGPQAGQVVFHVHIHFLAGW